MRADVRRDLKGSSCAFLDLVWPQIGSKVGGGEILPVEAVTESDFANGALDMLAGIDAWQKLPNGIGMRGISSRVQPTGRSFDTFTIRYSRDSGIETEFSKRKRAIESPMGLLYPPITIQAYVTKDGEKLISAAVAYTKDIIYVIDRCTQGRKFGDRKDWYLDRTSNATFAVVEWKTLKRYRFKLYEYRASACKLRCN